MARRTRVGHRKSSVTTCDHQSEAGKALQARAILPIGRPPSPRRQHHAVQRRPATCFQVWVAPHRP
jgi:hypothetical protein